MPKAKSDIFNLMTKGMTQKYSTFFEQQGIAIEMLTLKNKIILRKRKRIEREATPAQKYWREKYRDIEQMWRNMTIEQKYVFRKFLEAKQIRENVKATIKREKAKKTPFYEGKDLSEKAIFLHLAMKDKLNQFLSDFLKQEIIITNVDVKNDIIEFEFKVKHEEIDVEIDFCEEYPRIFRRI